MKRTLAAAVMVLTISAAARSAPLILWYKRPARVWVEALPIGNGQHGAMVFGNPTNEHFQLNEKSVWSGDSRPFVRHQDLP